MADPQDEKFAVNLLRVLGAQLALQSSLAVAREMFGKSYLSLGHGEKVAVDQAVFGYTVANYQTLTPEFLADQQGRQPMGFPIQAPSPTTGNSQTP
jgi:hypothetical protein